MKKTNYNKLIVSEKKAAYICEGKCTAGIIPASTFAYGFNEDEPFVLVVCEDNGEMRPVKPPYQTSNSALAQSYDTNGYDGPEGKWYLYASKVRRFHAVIVEGDLHNEGRILLLEKEEGEFVWRGWVLSEDWKKSKVDYTLLDELNVDAEEMYRNLSESMNDNNLTEANFLFVSWKGKQV